MILSINTSSRIFACSLFFLFHLCLAAVNISEAAPEKTGPHIISGPVAVLPVSNLSRTSAPLLKIRRLVIDRLRESGFNILDEVITDAFMARHRVRYISGIDRTTADALSRETGAGAVLIISLEHYDEKDPPKIAVTLRLVSAGESPEVLWMDSAGPAGDDSPGILGLGLVSDPLVLVDDALDDLLDSLSQYVSDTEKEINRARNEKMYSAGRNLRKPPAESSYKSKKLLGGIFEKEEGRFSPKIYHRSSFIIERDRRYTIAVLPFFNISERKYAGRIMEQHFLREVRRLKNLDPVEPGLVRNALLKSRVIMRDGISLDNAKVISSMLKADFVLTGTVIAYQDYTGEYGVPRVDFSVMLIERRSGEAVWTSKSYNEGDDGVFFFDFGKVNTAHSMAYEMSRAVAEMMFLR